MGFFSSSKSPEMARETPQPATPTNENPEPARPGTSGTEMLLVNNRQRASHRYKDAQKKERDYKTKKRSESARANYTAAKNHFRQGIHHNLAGVRMSWGVVASVGYLVRDKNDKLKREAAEKRKLRAADKERRAAERAAREKELLEKAAGGDRATIATEADAAEAA